MIPAEGDAEGAVEEGDTEGAVGPAASVDVPPLETMVLDDA